jgi:LysM repeat protein
MLRILGIALLCLAALAPIRVSADAPTIIVQPGDVLGTIAAREGVTVAELKRWNDLRSDMIRAGQKLVVGPKAQSAPAPKVQQATAKDVAEAFEADDDGIDWTPPFDDQAKPKVELPTQRSKPIAARDPSTAVAVRATEKKPAAPKKKRTYQIKKGDTLSGIALRHNTTVELLMKQNPGLRPTRIHPGQTIDLGEPTPEVVFRLERGDTLAAAAGRYGVSTRDLARWNGSLDVRGTRPGTKVRIYTRKPVSASEAVGPTNRGRLENPARLQPHRGYVIRTPARAYGTEETIRWVVDAFDAVDAKFKHTKVVRIHDISDKNGGHLRDHKSHQNGRDVDISYYQKQCGANGCKFQDFRSSDLDVARQWALLEHWLRNGQAAMIFVDYRLQAKLYKYAKRRGVPKAKLEEWIQYPRGKYEPDGIIRHFPNHEDHLHVRFVCPYSDLKCRR